MIPAHPVQMAGLSQKMAKMLFMDCPPNYICGGPAYAALASMDAILGIMGVGIAMIQRQGGNTEEYQKYVKDTCIVGDGILKTYIQHKSQILAGALHAVLCDLRTRKPRECREVTDNALLALIQWYLKSTNEDPKAFAKKIIEGGHNELEQLELDLMPEKGRKAPTTPD